MTGKPWTKMTAAELAKATREFEDGPGPRAIKPPPGELAKHRGVMRKTRRRGRPPLGNGAARVLFTIDPGLLKRLDAFARKHGLKRSRLITVSVESYIRARGNRGRSDAGTPYSEASSAPASKPSPLAAMAS
jgi:hypothetical protein